MFEILLITKKYDLQSHYIFFFNTNNQPINWEFSSHKNHEVAQKFEFNWFLERKSPQKLYHRIPYAATKFSYNDSTRNWKVAV